MIILLTLIACGIGGSETATTEPQSTELLIYTAVREQFAQEYANDFRQQYPHIDVTVISQSTGNITEKFLSERDDPQADIIWALGATSLLQIAAEGLLEPYAPEGLDRVDRRMRSAEEPPLFVGTDVFMSAFCINTDVLEARGLPLPLSWQDLTNPIYENQIVMPDPNISGTGYIALSGFMHLFERESDGWAFMDALDRNIILYTRSGSAPCRRAAAGDVPIGISLGAEASRQQSAEPAMVAVFPAEGSGWELEANALVRKPEIKPEATLFLDWAISDRAMREYAQNFPVTSVPTDVQLPEGYTQEPYQQLISNWQFFWVTANKARLVEVWDSEYGSKSEARGAEIPDGFGLSN